MFVCSCLVFFRGNIQYHVVLESVFTLRVRLEHLAPVVEPLEERVKRLGNLANIVRVRKPPECPRFQKRNLARRPEEIHIHALARRVLNHAGKPRVARNDLVKEPVARSTVARIHVATNIVAPSDER